MASEDKEKLKAKKEELKKKEKQKKELEKKIKPLQKKIEDLRKFLRGKLLALVLNLKEKHRKNLEIERRSLELKKELSTPDKESLKKIENLISFFDRFKKFYDNEVEPGLRNLKSFFKLFFFTYGIIKPRNIFYELSEPFKIIIYLNDKRILELGEETHIIKKIKEDLEVLPGIMENYIKELKELKKLERECKKLS